MKTSWLRGLLLLLGVVIPRGAAGVPAADSSTPWPEFHGPGRTNVSPDSGLLKKWPDGGPPVIWKYAACGAGYSGVSIADGKLFSAGVFGDEERVFALDPSGKPLWQTPNGKPWRGPCPGSRATPTYSQGALYHMNANGRLAAFDAASGKPLWAVDLPAEFDARPSIWGYAENVIVDGDKVLCMPGGVKGRVAALDRRTGKTLWTNTAFTETAAYCSPVIVVHQGVRQWLSMTQKSVVSVDPETGKLLWSAPFAPRSPQNALTPVYHDGMVFVACGHRSGGTVLKIDQAARTAAEVWYREDLDNCHGGALLVGDKLFGCGCRQGGKNFYCVDFRTGQTKKLNNTLGKVGVTLADGMIYCLNHQGLVSLLAVTPESFEIVSQFDLGRKPANTYLAHPVVCGGRLYLRWDETLAVYDVRAK